MRRASQRGFALGVLALLVVLAIAATFLQPGSELPEGSVDALEPAGRRALLLLLRESGFDADAWREAPGRLSREGDVLLWLPRPPPKSGPAAPSKLREKPEDALPSPPTSPARAGAFGLAHYREFLDAGGTLLIPASDEARKFLVEDLGIAASAIPERSKDAAAGTRTFTDVRGEELAVDVVKGGVLLPPAPGSPYREILSDSTDAGVLAAEIPVGRGRVVLLGDDAFLSNAHLGEHDHALLAVRLAEALAPGKRVLFDEYALGTWRPGTPASILASPKLFLATLHALLLLALLVLRAAWAREFPRDPASQATASALLRARALAGLLVRAGRFDVLSKYLLEGAARGIERRSPEAARALAGRASPAHSANDLERLAGEVRAIERAAG